MKEFIIPLLIAILSGLGVGSGGLLVIYLTLIENVPQILAQGMNLIFFICASTSSVIYNIKKRSIPVRLVLLLSVIGILGSFLGTKLSLIIHESITRKIFGAMLILSGISAFRKK